jgi:hypothetical protein
MNWESATWDLTGERRDGVGTPVERVYAARAQIESTPSRDGWTMGDDGSSTGTGTDDGHQEADFLDPLSPQYPMYWAEWMCPSCGEDGDMNALRDTTSCPNCGHDLVAP